MKVIDEKNAIYFYSIFFFFKCMGFSSCPLTTHFQYSTNCLQYSSNTKDFNLTGAGILMIASPCEQSWKTE